MLPVTQTDIKVQCMESLVGIRTGCTVEQDYPFWIEDIEGVDVKKLASMAKASNENGKSVAKQLINNAARQMLGDIETLINNGYRLNQIIGDMCSTCSLLPSYTANSGIIATSAAPSRYGIMKLTRLTMLTNVTGLRTIKIDDGINPLFYDVNLIADTLIPVNLTTPYTTTQPSFSISFTDPTVGLGVITCATKTGCGCGGSVNANNPVNLKGHINGIGTTVQYGFLPCISVTCSYDMLICNLIQQTPNVFGLTLLYKVGELYHENKKVADRNNDAVSFNEDPQNNPEQSMRNKYAIRYWARLKGSSGVTGINTFVSNYLGTNRGDKCIICDAKIKTAYATG